MATCLKVSTQEDQARGSCELDQFELQAIWGNNWFILIDNIYE